jgi:putative heme-binding domain-containing protein
MKNYLKKIPILILVFLALVIVSWDSEQVGDPKTEKIVVPEGFIIEHIYSPSDNDQGSWVAMTFDDKGRMITSDQYGGLYRLEIPAIGSGSVKPKIEKLTVGADSTIGYAQGLLYAFNSLYVMVNNTPNNVKNGNGKASGFYRLQDTNNDDKFDKITELLPLEGNGEHGPHSIVLSPDGKSIYIVAGNHTDVPKMDHYRLPNTWQEDNLFPLIKDPRGHANDRMAPGGWVAKTDPEGKSFELINAGYRNAYDLAFNDIGDMFVYDADMEWDFGMPWYRPTRVSHSPSGAEFGWRTGNSKWSPSYPDNLPAISNIGQGSPTNLMYGGNAKFPEKYRKSLYAFDWSFGIVYAISPSPKGASYEATTEEFISGSPLPLTDGEIGPDGAMYFLTGGRRLSADIYRVYHKDYKTFKAPNNLTQETPEAKIRKQLEVFHGAGSHPTAVSVSWPYLKHADRNIRYAARIAIEHQPVNSWRNLALNETDPRAVTEAMIALARVEDASSKSAIFKKLVSVNAASLSAEQKLNLFRAIELAILRLGEPDNQDKAAVINYLNPLFPANNNELDRELAKILVHLDSPEAIKKTVALLKVAKDDLSYQQTAMSSSDLIMRNPQYGLDIAAMLAKTPPAQQVYLATVLSGANAKSGWTPELRESYFTWFHTAFGYKGGNSYVGFIDAARKMALANVPQADSARYNVMSGSELLSGTGRGVALAATGIRPVGPRGNWTVDTALPVVEADSGNRDFARGKAMFAATNCIACHSVQGEGGSSGPDLTQLGTRFSPKDMLTAIILPSETISDQYGSTVLTLKDGTSILGRVVNETANSYVISQNPYAPQTLREVPKANVAEVKVSEVSIMPPGTISPLNKDELKDLMAYLMSGGNENHAVFKPKN